MKEYFRWASQFRGLQVRLNSEPVPGPRFVFRIAWSSRRSLSHTIKLLKSKLFCRICGLHKVHFRFLHGPRQDSESEALRCFSRPAAASGDESNSGINSFLTGLALRFYRFLISTTIPPQLAESKQSGGHAKVRIKGLAS